MFYIWRGKHNLVCTLTDVLTFDHTCQLTGFLGSSGSDTDSHLHVRPYVALHCCSCIEYADTTARTQHEVWPNMQMGVCVTAKEFKKHG